MADKFINETGVATIRDWANGKYVTKAALQAVQDEVDQIVAEGGEPNVIETVKVNGTALTPDAQKAVDVTVPTAVSDLTNDGDGTSPFATQEYVGENGGKIQKVKVNGTEQTIDTSDKSVNITVPTLGTDANPNGYATYNGVASSGAELQQQIVALANQKANVSDIPTAVSDLTNDSGYQTAADVQSAISTAVASAYKYKGSVATQADLPSSGNTAGDVWDVQDTGINYAWTGTAWDALGSYVDTSILWTSQTGQTNSLNAMTVAEINAILEPSA